MSQYEYTGRARACAHCGHAPTLKTEQAGRVWSAWIECHCGITTRRQRADNMRHANSAALYHWNTRDGEARASNATHQLRQAALAFVHNWRDGQFTLPDDARPDAQAIEKALRRVYNATVGKAA